MILPEYIPIAFSFVCKSLILEALRLLEEDEELEEEDEDDELLLLAKVPTRLLGRFPPVTENVFLASEFERILI